MKQHTEDKHKHAITPARKNKDFSLKWGYTPAMLRTGSQRAETFSKIYTRNYEIYSNNATPYSDILSTINTKTASKLDTLHKSMHLWQQTVLPAYILTVLGDRAEMANSIEGRLPFLDSDVVKALQGAPTELKINENLEKFILREAMRGRVHPSIINQTKSPFISPPAQVRNGKSPLRDYMGDIFYSSRASDQPFYCVKKIRKMFNQTDMIGDTKKAETDRILTFALSVCIMHKTFSMTTSSPPQ